jgi:glycosyltransferase involved in cell wall biosynthesis
MNKPLISVVIATYNMGCYLPFAIRSVLDQTYRNMEILVVDDGSTDDTSHTLEPFLDDSRVRYYVQRNRGQAAAKNHGLGRSKGEYVAFLDADDMWAPDKLDLQFPLFSTSESVGVVYSRVSYIDETGRDLGIADNELFRGRVSGPLLIRNFIGFGTAVVKKQCFERLGGFKENLRMGIDYDLWLRFSTQYEFEYIDRPLLRYRVWPGQISKNVKDRYLHGIEIMRTFLQEYPGVVDKATVNEAWAHTYVGFGQCVQDFDHSVSSACKLYMRALRYRPGYLPAWKAMIRAILSS